MRLKISVFVLFLSALSIPALAQRCAFPCVSVPNEGTTGTAANKLAKLTGAPSTAIISTAGDTSGAIGISTNGGTAGNAYVMTSGTAVSCVFDGATTAGDYVSISASVAGDCTDAGSTCPANQVIGRILQTHGSAGTYPILMSIGVCSTSGGPVSGSGTANTVAKFTGASTIGNSQATDNGTTFSLTGVLGLPATSGATVGVINMGAHAFLQSYPSGNANVFLGANTNAAGNFTTTGNNLTGLGDSALRRDAAGTDNTAVGVQTLAFTTSGNYNVAVGANGLDANTTGSSNTSVGGDSNTSALGANTTGSHNSGFGDNACQTITTGSNNTCAGADSDVGGATLTNAFAIGQGAIVAASNTGQLGNTSVTKVQTSGALNASLGYQVAGSVFVSGTAPTVASGFGTGAAVTHNSGTAAFSVAVGTTSATTGVLTMPAAANGWACSCADITTNSNTVFYCKQQPTSNATQITLGIYTNANAAHAPADNDVLAVQCGAY